MKMGNNAYPGNSPADTTGSGSQMWYRGSEYSGVGTANGYIPPAGTSARKAFDRRKAQGGTGTPGSVRDRLQGNYDSPLNDAVDDILDGDKPRPPAKHGHPDNSARQMWSYYEAPIAEYYGFGKETAYQEALANTAYRREMTDMKKAGLNPSVIYGAHNSSGADSSIIPRSSSGGGGGGSRHRYGKTAQKGISKTAYYGIQLAATGIGAMLGGRGGAFVGATVGRTAAQLIGSLF